MISGLRICLLLLACLCSASAYCEVEWFGLPNSYRFSGRRDGRISFDDCCANTRQEAAVAAQNTLNTESVRMQAAVSNSIGASYNGNAITVEQTSSSSSDQTIIFGPHRWSVTTDCFCITDDFISLEGGCQPTSLSNLFGRKLKQTCAPVGREPDTCNIKIQCKYKAVTPTLTCFY